VIEAASAYEPNLRNAAAIRAGFRDGEAVSQAMNVGGGYQPEQMERGRDRLRGADRIGGRGLRARRPTLRAWARGWRREADALLANPAEAGLDPGSGRSRALDRAVLREEGVQLFHRRARRSNIGYEVQHQAWSKQTVPDPKVRLAKAKSLAASAVHSSARGRLASVQVGHRLSRKTYGGRPGSGGVTPVIQRGLALAPWPCSARRRTSLG